jgi:hypothetical protein
VIFNCYASVDDWGNIQDAVPKALSFLGEVHSGFVLHRGFVAPQGPNPILAPIFKCIVGPSYYASLRVTLKAYLSN